MVKPDDRGPGLDEVDGVRPDAEDLLVAHEQQKKEQKVTWRSHLKNKNNTDIMLTWAADCLDFCLMISQ